MGLGVEAKRSPSPDPQGRRTGILPSPDKSYTRRWSDVPYFCLPWTRRSVKLRRNVTTLVSVLEGVDRTKTKVPFNTSGRSPGTGSTSNTETGDGSGSPPMTSSLTRQNPRQFPLLPTRWIGPVGRENPETGCLPSGIWTTTGVGSLSMGV